MSIQLGQKVKHFVGRDATYMSHAKGGYLVGIVHAIYESDSYALKNKNYEFVLKGIKNAVLIKDSELDDEVVSEPIVKMPTTTHHAAQPINPSIPEKRKVARAPRATDGSSKKELAEQLYNEFSSNHPTEITRSDIVNLFIEKLGMSKGGATTYSYYYLPSK